MRKLIGLLSLAVILVVPGVANPPERGEPLPRRAALGAALAAESGGLRINAVVPGQTAEALGVQPGDLLTAMAGEAVTTSAEIGAVLRRMAAGDNITLTVERDGETLELAGALIERPRQQPDGFTVHYDQVVSNGNRIRIIATSPETPGPHPTLFLIGGIGGYSVDGDFGSIAYGNILEPFAKAGFATVRIDKPGQGDSEGPEYAELLYSQERDAYLQAIRLAKTLDFVDADRIIIFGHSMGGCFGPQIAAEEPLFGLIVHGTLARTWLEYSLENTRRQSELAGTPAPMVHATMLQFSRMAHYLFSEGMSPAEIREAHPELAGILRSISPDDRTYSGVGLPFFQELAQENFAQAWAGIGEANVLTLWGENDFVAAAWDHEAIVRWVNARREGAGTYVRIPESDHAFLRTSSPRNSQENWGRGGEFNPNIIEIMQEWLDRVLAG